MPFSSPRLNLTCSPWAECRTKGTLLGAGRESRFVCPKRVRPPRALVAVVLVLVVSWRRAVGRLTLVAGTTVTAIVRAATQRAMATPLRRFCVQTPRRSSFVHVSKKCTYTLFCTLSPARGAQRQVGPKAGLRPDPTGDNPPPKIPHNEKSGGSDPKDRGGSNAVTTWNQINTSDPNRRFCKEAAVHGTGR